MKEIQLVCTVDCLFYLCTIPIPRLYFCFSLPFHLSCSFIDDHVCAALWYQAYVSLDGFVINVLNQVPQMEPSKYMVWILKLDTKQPIGFTGYNTHGARKLDFSYFSVSWSIVETIFDCSLVNTGIHAVRK